MFNLRKVSNYFHIHMCRCIVCTTVYGKISHSFHDSCVFRSVSYVAGSNRPSSGGELSSYAKACSDIMLYPFTTFNCHVFMMCSFLTFVPQSVNTYLIRSQSCRSSLCIYYAALLLIQSYRT